MTVNGADGPVLRAALLGRPRHQRPPPGHRRARSAGRPTASPSACRSSATPTATAPRSGPPASSPSRSAASRPRPDTDRHRVAAWPMGGEPRFVVTTTVRDAPRAASTPRGDQSALIRLQRLAGNHAVAGAFAQVQRSCCGGCTSARLRGAATTRPDRRAPGHGAALLHRGLRALRRGAATRRGGDRQSRGRPRRRRRSAVRQRQAGTQDADNRQAAAGELRQQLVVDRSRGVDPLHQDQALPRCR